MFSIYQGNNAESIINKKKRKEKELDTFMSIPTT